MNSKTIDTFSSALRAVFEESGFRDFTIDEPVHRSNGTSRSVQVNISVGLAGMFKGFLFLQAQREDATRHASMMSAQLGVPLDTPDVFGTMHKAALSELTNQISGRATMLLSEIGIDTSITPPTVVTGDNVDATFSGSLSFVDIGVHSAAGQLNVAIGYLEE